MKSTIKKNTWRAIYRLLDRVSPVDYDCGTLCGSVCCVCPDHSSDADDEEMGIYLYPGEEKIHNKKDTWLKWSVERAEDYELPDSWCGNIYFVRCLTPPNCPRTLRPLQCRTFPLSPHITADGILTLVRNDEPLPYICPLIEEHVTLNPDFVQATYTVWKHLVRDPFIFDLIEMDSRLREMEYEPIYEPLP